MSLRLRLTLLYTTLLGSILLLFGGLVYGLVSVILINNIDRTLQQTSDDLLEMLRVSSAGQFDARSISTYQPTENLLIQVWGSDHRLQISRPTGWKVSLDQNAWLEGSTNFSTATTEGQHLRILTTPLNSIRGPAGILQVGVDLSLMDVIQQTLSKILMGLTAFALLITCIFTWLMTGRALAPLSTITNIATQITRADDLSRRIPLEGASEDEVGRLVQAFNKTLERLEKLFGSQQRFLADVSHELRTPLTVIKGNIGIIRKFGPDEESLSGIEGEVDRLTRMVGDLLLLNQAESGSMPLDLVKVSLDGVLLEVIQQMHVLAGKKVKLNLVSIDQAQVNGDHDRIKQVFLNLLSNAISYTPKNGKVDISLEKLNGQARVTIADTGPGISEADLPHIFERFYRGDKSRTHTATSGFGLGLSIAKWITEKLGGRIEVESKVGVGTKFIVYFPLLEE